LNAEFASGFAGVDQANVGSEFRLVKPDIQPAWSVESTRQRRTPAA
jgi:hypothetical protein